MSTEEIVIDTDSVGFRLAVQIRRCTLALQDFREAWEESERTELARLRAARAKAARHRAAFDALVREEFGR